jgi:hypothetical protein
MMSELTIKRGNYKFDYMVEEVFPDEYSYNITYGDNVYIRNYCISSNRLAVQHEAGELAKMLNKLYFKD